MRRKSRCSFERRICQQFPSLETWTSQIHLRAFDRPAPNSTSNNDETLHCQVYAMMRCQILTAMLPVLKRTRGRRWERKFGLNGAWARGSRMCGAPCVQTPQLDQCTKLTTRVRLSVWPVQGFGQAWATSGCLTLFPSPQTQVSRGKRSTIQQIGFSNGACSTVSPGTDLGRGRLFPWVLQSRVCQKGSWSFWELPCANASWRSRGQPAKGHTKALFLKQWKASGPLTGQRSVLQKKKTKHGQHSHFRG